MTTTTTPTPITCPKCGYNTTSGQSSCCFRNGTWFEKCGDVGDPNFNYTWFDGIRACISKLAVAWMHTSCLACLFLQSLGVNQSICLQDQPQLRLQPALPQPRLPPLVQPRSQRFPQRNVLLRPENVPSVSATGNPAH